MSEPNRFHDNLIYGFGCLDSSRPLSWDDALDSPRVYGRPTNIRQIVSWWGRLKAAYLVLTLNAVAVRWYDEKNAHQYGKCWHEWVRERHGAMDKKRYPDTLLRQGGSVATEAESKHLPRQG